VGLFVVGIIILIALAGAGTAVTPPAMRP